MRKDKELIKQIVISNEAELKVLSAMEQQAIAFARWLVSERWKIEFKEQKNFTYTELYQIFNNPTNGE